jgi:thiol:disulfide interchange protein DsbD
MPAFRLATAVLACTLPIGAALAESGPVRVDHATVELVSERLAVAPGERFHAGLRIRHDPDWHTYWINPGDSGLATRIDWRLPEGVAAGPIQWPAPHRFDLGGIVNFGYEGDLLLPVPLTVDAGIAPGTRLAVAAKASWLICKDICIPGDAELSVAVDVVAPGDAIPAARPEVAERFIASMAAMPRELAGIEARFADRGDAIDVVIAGLPAGIDPEALEIFPVEAQILASAAAPAARLADGLIGVRTPKNDYFVGLPERFGLVVAHGRGPTREAWTVTAVAGAVPVLPDPATGPVAAPASGAAPAGTGAQGLLLAMLFALAGGVILNLMPCVFPVLALKAMGLMHSAHDRRLARRHGLFYLAGVLASFLALGGLLVALRAGGEALGWGFQLQLPWVVGGLALLMLAMGLSLSGLFEIGGRFMNLGSELAGGEGDRASFFTGVLAVLVASPCTAPFMGPALGFAATQPAAIALAVFGALGLGLALPIVLVSFVPRLARLLPRPGPWMETFKQAMAFPLYLTAVWLLWVLGRQAGVDALAVVLAGATVMAFGLWLVGRSPSPSPASRVGAIAALALAIGSLAWASGREAPQAQSSAMAVTAHEAWTPARHAELRAAGRPVLVNMTAAWCITCLANERVALASERFQADLERHGITYLKGDWTHRDPAITAYLARYGRNGVPLYVVYPRGTGDGEVLPQLLTPDLVSQALARAGSGPAPASPAQTRN